MKAKIIFYDKHDRPLAVGDCVISGGIIDEGMMTGIRTGIVSHCIIEDRFGQKRLSIGVPKRKRLRERLFPSLFPVTKYDIGISSDAISRGDDIQLMQVRIA